MIKKKGMPITGAQPEYSKKRPYVPNAKDTSVAGMKNVAAAPMPFKNSASIPNIPAPNAASGGVSTLMPKIQSGLKNQTVGARALPPVGPVGQKKQPNQSGQVFGRMGTSAPSKVGQNGAGYPQAGGGGQIRGSVEKGIGGPAGSAPAAGSFLPVKNNAMSGQAKSSATKIPHSAVATKKPNRKGVAAFYVES